MDYKVILSPRAIQDLSEIVRYISLNNPREAESFGYALIDAALSLGNLPERGRYVPEFADGITREIVYTHIALSIELAWNKRRYGFPDSGTPLEGYRRFSEILPGAAAPGPFNRVAPIPSSSKFAPRAPSGPVS